MTLRHLLILVIGAALAGCTTTVIPPVNPENPTPVFLIDHGQHTSLVLPYDNGRLVEYAYGEWNWFANNLTDSPNTIPALLLPTRGAFGRRTLQGAQNVEDLQRAYPDETIEPIDVAMEHVLTLVDQLEARFAANTETAVLKPEADLTIVEDDTSYHIFHNCNHVTFGWLRDLGCEVKGPTMFADFRVLREDPTLPEDDPIASDVLAEAD
ncbi:MAG: DUF2459 domain-containing protein [Planctomycetota bacterium]|jgi:hypothetical protein